MSNIKYDIKCPKCNHLNKFKVQNTFSSEKIIDIINKKIFKFTCTSCHQEILIEYPFKVTGSNYIVHYTPTLSDEIEDETKEYMRVCDTFDDLKEKLLVLNDNLNDIIIEYIKDFLINNIDDDLRKNTLEIRYNGINDTNILFSLIGENKVIGVDRSFYDKILKKIKMKKINKCVLIDKYTYQKFYKKRLI